MSLNERTADNPMYGILGLIRRGERVLLIQRSQFVRVPLAWCFPGGEIEPGETHEAALMREMREEIGLDVLPGRHLMTQVKHDGRLILHCWSAEILSGEPTPNPREVAAVAWATPGEIRLMQGILPGTAEILDGVGW